MIRAYIDIDGVLIRNSKSGPELIPNFCRIIKYLRKNFDCYWLTTHVRCNSGSTGAVTKLAEYLKKRGIDPKVLDGIKPTTWQTLKTEAIDFGQPCIWLEDNLLTVERKICNEKKCSGCIITIDWQKRASRLTVRRLRRIRREAVRRLFNQPSKGGV